MGFMNRGEKVSVRRKGLRIINPKERNAKLRWLQDFSEMVILGTMYGVKPAGISGKMEYMKEKSNELATNSKRKGIRDMIREIHEFKRAANLKVTY
jgi:hypothetical protein